MKKLIETNLPVSKVINTSRGFNIKLKGAADRSLRSCVQPRTFAVKPTDFIGLVRPKVLVSVGDEVQAGTPLLFSKLAPEILYTSPVSGEVVAIERGAKRRLLAVVILADANLEESISYLGFLPHTHEEVNKSPREDLVKNICNSGLWPQLVRRPYGIVADPSEVPSAIFISSADTSPLASDYPYAFEEDKNAFVMGLTVLRKLSGEDVHISLIKNRKAGFMEGLGSVRYHYFQGPHPVGNVGVQLHHVRPIKNANDVVWTISPYGVIEIGRLFLHGKYDTRHRIAVAGPLVSKPAYVSAYKGACIAPFVADNLTTSNARYISGNVLTGERITEQGHLGYYHYQLTIIEEGNYQEPFGWILPSFSKLSLQRGLGLFSFLRPNAAYNLDSNLHGELRAFVQTGLIERFLPMDVLLTFLLKAIIAHDYEEMEALGIYELIEEDVALCEFADVSKNEIQSLVRQGLDLLRNS